MGQNQADGRKIGKAEIFWGLLLVVSIVCMWMAQRAVPVMMDDEWYGTILSSDRPLTSLRDILHAQIWHYHNWGGRTVAHTMAQLILLYVSEPVANVLNVAMIVLLAWMMNAMMGNRRLAFVTLTIGFLHGLNADWKMSMYWQTGACNYLYTTVLILAFLWMYLRELERSPERGRGETARPLGGQRRGFPLLIVLAPVLGLLSGWTNENMGPAVWVLTILVMILLKRAGQKIALWMPLGSAACLAGSALMLLAPGNAVRSAEVVSHEYGTLWQIFLRMYGVCRGAWEYLFPAILVTVGLVWVNVCVLGNRLRKQETLLLTGAALSWGAMALSPHYPERAAFGTLCFLLCVAFSQAASILKSRNNRFCAPALAGLGVFIWLRGMFVLGEFLSISWGWIR
ncbi:MAG: DUF6056 family protein [Clostridium sp.]|nr:DUF6056 family protein [Acetatifactor muris]MCM1527445.1 DUF6056 family protein [Bacteroides sp.]MCM1562109.1 DUF6056 family protein [Clostridium sp.]